MQDKEKMKRILEKNMRYQKYLESVLDASEDYSEISELLMRYETLTAHFTDLTERAARCAEQSDSFRQQLQAHTKAGDHVRNVDVVRRVRT
jgi:uncharacterized coiled-coil DUF342 family protein